MITVDLQSVAEIKGGGKLALSGKDFVDDGFPAYGAGGVNGRVNVAEYHRPAVILSSIGARCGKCFLAEGGWTSLANTQLILPDLEHVDPKFLWYQLNDERRWHRSGTGQPFIKPADVKSHQVWVPPLDEQRRIAAILDHADGLRAKRRRAIAQLGDLAESIFLDLFPEDAADAVSFDSVVTNFRNGLSPAKAGTVMADVLTLSAVTQGIFDPTAVKTSTFMAKPPAPMRVSGDDFLICRGNGNLNLVGVGVSPGHSYPDLIFPDTVIAASFDAAKVDPVYLEMTWKRPSVRRQIESVARTTNGTYKINQQSLGSVRIVIPPLSEQQEFARRISALPNPGLSELDELFASLQSRAFSGQL